MKFRFNVAMLLSVSVLSLSLMTGCTNTERSGDDPAVPEANGGGEEAVPFDHTDVPITDEQKAEMKKQATTLGGAIAMIKEYRDAVEVETKDGIPANPFEAHQALDKADIVTEWLPQIAMDSGIANEQIMKVTPAARALQEAFDKVHLNIDAGKNPDFASVKDLINAKITELEAIAQ